MLHSINKSYEKLMKDGVDGIARHENCSYKSVLKTLAIELVVNAHIKNKHKAGKAIKAPVIQTNSINLKEQPRKANRGKHRALRLRISLCLY